MERQPDGLTDGEWVAEVVRLVSHSASAEEILNLWYLKGRRRDLQQRVRSVLGTDKAIWLNEIVGRPSRNGRSLSQIR